MRYSNHSNYHRRKKVINRVLIAFAIISVAGLIYAGQYIMRNYFQEETKLSETPVETVGFFAPSTEIYRTSHFQFQANKSWTQDVNESTQSKYLYRSYRGPLIEHELTIYVNSIPEGLAVTRVLPVTYNAELKGLNLQPVSESCGKNLPDKKRLIQQTTVNGVSLHCNVDDNNYTILVGMVGGSTNLSLAKPDGSTAHLVIHYRNVTANPGSAELEQLMKTFQVR